MTQTIFTLAEAADILRLSPTAVRRRIQAGQITAWNEKGRAGWRIPAEALQAYQQRHTATGEGRITARSPRSQAARKAAATRAARKAA